MQRTEFTYGQLDKVLRSLGFSCRMDPSDPPTRRRSRLRLRDFPAACVREDASDLATAIGARRMFL